MKTEPELLSIAAAAKRLGRGWEWTLEAAKSGDLPGVEIKGRWYVRNLGAFLDAKQTRPKPGVRDVVAERAQQRSRAEERAALGLEPEGIFS